ncbi:hypothetical protein M3Y97_00003500 [Aphelenchoides bicaudatus]|nr:hypothetical protein M3Y97_00003500 [Aphelenchoides bicaudatus]
MMQIRVLVCTTHLAVFYKTMIGLLQCETDETKHANVPVFLRERDGLGWLQFLDADDHMGMTYTDNTGMFKIYGCGSDPDFVYRNKPEFYHRCNEEDGQWFQTDEFDTPKSDEYAIGVVDLTKNTAAH